MRIGIERLLNEHKGWLKGRRIGLLSHQAAVDADGTSTAEALRAAFGENLAALFGPEHGYDGHAAAGETVGGALHDAWGIPVYSLFGGNHAPEPSMLENIDVLVCDLQDLGTRCYTYLATLQRVLQACETCGVETIVCDRPVPLPCVVDGPLVADGWESFVAPAGLPMLTGMTPGETALWLTRGQHRSAPLRVAWMDGWTRDGRRAPDWPEFIPPSPGIRTWESATAYAATVFSEALPDLDVGRATNMAFRVVGAPWLDGREMAGVLNAAGLGGVRFHPFRYVAAENSAHAGTLLNAVRLTVTDPRLFRPVQTTAVMLDTFARHYGAGRVWQGEGANHRGFDTLFGGPALREALQSRCDRVALLRLCHEDHDGFLASRAEVLRYDT